MTKVEINLSEGKVAAEKNRKNYIEAKENSDRKCVVCTGCGRCGFVGKRDNFQVVTGWQRAKSGAAEGESADESMAGNASMRRQYEELANVSKTELLIATDIGTTTIAMQLRRIRDGEVLDTFRAVNPQRKYGADVLSRIQAASAFSPAEEMRNMVLGILQEGISQFRKSAVASSNGHREDNTENIDNKNGNITGMVIAANTTMIHLLMGYPTESLGKAPFVSGYLDETKTTICGIKTLIMPGFSTFVGADIFAGMWACEMGESEEITLFLDLGTNGEIVLGNKERLVATATAAGPAFEGRLDAAVWGADAVGFLAALYREGMVDETGLLAEEYFETGVSIGGTVMTQEDVRSLQLAKAAIFAGIDILREEYGLRSITEIDRVILAGGLGYYLSPLDAADIGLIPAELASKCVSVGNAALEGAFCYGRRYFEEQMQTGTGVLEKTKVYNLADSHKFMQCYMAAINLPEMRK